METWPLDNSTLLIAIAAALGCALLLVAVVFAYREGKRIGVLTRSERFNRLSTPLRLHATEWDIRFTEFGPQGTQEHASRMWFRQYDSRVIGEGEDESGRRWTAEGVLFQDKICLVILDADQSGRSLGSVMVDQRDCGEIFDGMRCVWSADQNAVIVQPIQFSRCTPRAFNEAPDHSRETVRIGDAC